MQIKICGITRPEDALAAFAAGADAIGLVFFAKSKRAVSIAKAKAICEVLPPLAQIVGLFVDASQQDIERVLSAVPLTLLQFHGNESPADCELWQRPYLRALDPVAGSDLNTLMAPYTDARGFLLDSVHEGAFGGTGKTFDWQLFPTNCSRPLILAGGLSPDNVAQAIRQCRPSAVDVSSGVESSPGVKDVAKMTAFVDAVRKIAKEERE